MGDSYEMTTLGDELGAARTERQHLSRKVEALERVVTGQAAMIALLTGLLTQHEVFSREEAVLVTTAAVDAQAHEGLSPNDVGDWIRAQLGKPKP